MSCIYFTKRTHKYKPYLFCRLNKQVITFNDCKNCSEIKYKEIKPIKKKSNKLSELEKNRYSILQEDNTKCYLCSRQLKLDTHEAFGGSNRKKSMQWGLVYYLCRVCHDETNVDKDIRQKLHDIARETFINKYGAEKFLKEFGKNYIRRN